MLERWYVRFLGGNFKVKIYILSFSSSKVRVCLGLYIFLGRDFGCLGVQEFFFFGIFLVGQIQGDLVILGWDNGFKVVRMRNQMKRKDIIFILSFLEDLKVQKAF